jgi:type 1 glutamine amidotransferase
MKPRVPLLASLAALTFVLPFAPLSAAEPIRALLVTGGHEYETNQFQELFKTIPNLTVNPVSHPQAQAWFAKDKAADYDIIVLYDMWQDIADDAKANFAARIREGKGLVALHHCLGSYQKWDEYVRIIGGRYHLDKHVENGVQKPGSTYKHDVTFNVRVANHQHPVTQGLEGFEIHDETYGGFEVKPDVDVLLTTQEPTSGPNLAWAKRYGEAKVVYIQLGHDHLAWENPGYKRLLTQAIHWTAGR